MPTLLPSDFINENTPSAWSVRQAMQRVIARRLRREAAAQVAGHPRPATENAETSVLTAARAPLAHKLNTPIHPLQLQRLTAESAALWRTAQLLEHLHLLPPVPPAVAARLQKIERVITRLTTGTKPDSSIPRHLEGHTLNATAE